jgi:hypothetical protein
MQGKGLEGQARRQVHGCALLGQRGRSAKYQQCPHAVWETIAIGINQSRAGLEEISLYK